MPSSRNRIATAGAGLAAVATLLFTVAPAASAAPPDAASAAHYLAGHLVGGTHLAYGGGKGPNYGGTADLAFALAAAGGHDGTLRPVLRYLAGHTAGYADPDGTGKYPGPYSGSAGKLAVLAESTGQDPRRFGGFDLLHTLTAHVCAKADSAGACTAPGDFYQAYSTVSQAFGVLALARAQVAVPPTALSRLEQLQCPDGGFSSKLITGHATCSSDVDTTGLALQALVLVPSAAHQVRSARRYLLHSQRGDGGFVGSAGENTNSTAFAIGGLLAADGPASDRAVRRAERWLGGQQNHDGGFGIGAAKPASDILATTQAIPAAARARITTMVHEIDLGARRKVPANTGFAAAGLLGWGALLLLAGGAVLVLARRRPATVRRR